MSTLIVFNLFIILVCVYMYVYTVYASLESIEARKGPEVTDSCESLWRGLELNSGSVEAYSVS